MKAPTKLKNSIIVLVLLLGSLQVFAQNFVDFSSPTKPPRFDQDLKGDILLIGNNILGPSNSAYTGNDTNDEVNMQYINVDAASDPTLFSSSSADLVVPNPECYQIIHAGLYWGANTPGTTAIQNVKFKGPSGGYNDITGEIIFNAGASSVDGGDSFPYACYADVTSIVRGLANNTGTYTVGNVSSATGRTEDVGNGTGHAAGWSLFIVYEDPRLPGKSITAYDGFSSISSTGGNATINVSGFRTIPTGPVRANFAFAALEGDQGINGDELRINGSSQESADRPINTTCFFFFCFNTYNFFNSTVSQLSGAPVNNRNPNSTNTLGFDTGILPVNNFGNSVIGNGDTSATIDFTTGGDTYFPYFVAFAVEIIEPKIVLTKIVEDEMGTNIGGQEVGLGQELNYVIGFQNTGNDDATNLTIRDVLPVNVDFNFPADLSPLPPGVSVQSYNPATRELIFNVDDSVVEIGDPVLEIRFKVSVVTSCSLLVDACTNLVDNQAFSTYNGTINTDFEITNEDPEGSFDTNTGCLLVPKATNILADLDDCIFDEEVTFCGDGTDLVAASGYDSYSWSTSPTGIPVIGTLQTLPVTAAGTYYVRNTAVAPCQSIEQVFTVIEFGAASNPNPVIPFADQVVQCPNDGSLLPKIFLCGASDVTEIETGITDASSIIWEVLDESSCPAVTNPDCANENAGCTWNSAGPQGPDFSADTAGQYRLTLNYDGGCFETYYFNVSENVFSPTHTARDIICNTAGEIVVNNVPSGYEYSIDGTTYQNSNVFSITTPNFYTVYIRQIINPQPADQCIFTIPDIQIRERNFSISTNITNPMCNGGLGSVNVAINDVRPQYYFSISNAGGIINNIGPINDNNYEFEDLNPGMYTISVSTDDGCTDTANIEITEPETFSASASVTNPLLNCGVDAAGDPIDTGEITVTVTGGTSPYAYFINGSTTFQLSPIIPIASPGGSYSIRVVDENNCVTTTTIDVDELQPPVFTISETDVLCANSGNTGAININVTNANGHALRYSINDGTTFSASPVFTGLAAGDYDVVVEYSTTYPTGVDTCFTSAQTITIDALSALSGDADLTTNYTCTTNGVITVSNVTGGTAPYEYSIDGINFQPGLTFTGLTNGSYTITIRDVNDCTFSPPAVIIAPLDPPTDLTITDKTFDCDDLTSSFNVNLPSSAGGLPPIRFQIVDLPPSIPVGSPLYNALTQVNADGQYSGVPSGVYTFRVIDRNGCTYEESFNLESAPPIGVSGRVIGNVSCFNLSNGSVEFNVSGTFTGGNNVYSYDVTGPVNFSDTRQTAPTITLNNLPAGTYNITVTERGTGCTDTASVTVTEPSAGVTFTTTSTNVFCTTDESQITVTASGGTPNYTYAAVVSGAGAPALADYASSNIITVDTNGATDLTWDVYVRDANGCTTDNPVTIIGDDLPTIDPVAQQCFDGTPFNITLSGTGVAPLEYSIGSGFQTSPTFTISASGTYTLTIRDANGCSATTTYVVAPQLTLTAGLTKDLDCTASPDAVIEGSIAGGIGPYTLAISINGGAYSPLPPPSGLTFTDSRNVIGNAVTTYQYRITDGNSCVAESAEITVNPIERPTATETVENPDCNGASTGSVQIIPADGVGPYEFSFDGSAFSTTSSYGSLAAGTYTYQVRDSKNCIFNGSVTLTAPSELTTTATVVGFSCDASNAVVAGTVTITLPTTGTAPYQYSFNGSGYSATNVLTVNDNGSDQTINYSVRDANGCIFNGSETLTALDSPTDLDFSNAAVTCAATTTTVTVTATGGVGTLTYQMISPGSVTPSGPLNNEFAGLTPDTYVFRVTDANGCYYEESYIVTPVTNIDVTGNVTSNVDCNGATTGAVEFTVSSFSGTYSYVFNSGTPVTGQSAATIPFTGLGAGSYTLDVTDETTQCNDTFTVTVTEPSAGVTFTATSTNVFCTNDESQITVTASGGTPNYTYAAVVSGAGAPALADYASSNIITVDTNGATDLVWDVYVRDANGCITDNPVTITNDALPTIDPVAQQCFDGTPFNITLSGTGVGTLEYSIGSGFQTSPTFTISASGTYTLTIRDDNGCPVTTTYEVAPQLTLNAGLTKDLDCTTSPDAVIEGTIAGGIGPYTLAVSINGGAYSALPPPSGLTFTDSRNVIGNAVTTYQYRITDANSCVAESAEITVNPIERPTATETVENPDCNGASTGSVQIIPANGVGPYEFSFDGSAFSTTSSYGSLAAGTYTYQVRDSKNCIFDGSVTLTAPSALTTTATAVAFSCDASNAVVAGTVTIALPTTGTAPYQYSFNGSGYSATNVLTVNDNGSDQTINYSVRDANGCIFNGSETLTALDSPTDLGFNNAAVTCAATTTTVTVTATGGVGTLTYQMISPGSVTPSGPLNNEFSGLTPDTYVFRVTDANGCYYEESYIVTPVTNIDITGNVTSNVDCNGATTGAVEFTVSSFSGTYSYVFNSGAPVTGQSAATIPFTGLGAGSYTLNVTDETTQCTDTFTVTVTEPSAGVTFTTMSTNVFCTNDESQITVTASGGTPNYTYAAVVSGAGAPVLADYASSNIITVDTNGATDLVWDVYVRDANGCITDNPVTINVDTAVTIAPVAQQCFDGTPFNITLSGTGVAPLEYSIGSGFQTSPTFTISASGTYTLSVRDANGCPATTTYVVEPQLIGSAILTKDLTCSSPVDATIDVTVSGGNPPYVTYEVSTNGGTTYTAVAPVPSGVPFTYTTSTAGTYQFRITDTNGCEFVTNSITVSTPADPEITSVTQTQDILCNGDETAAIGVVINNAQGLPPFVINVNNDTTSTDYGTQTSGLPAGNYTITLTGANGCTDTETIVISEPNAIDFDLTKVDITCNNPGGSSLGSITVENATGGTGNLTYFISNNFGDVIAGNPYSASPNEDHTFTIINFGTYTVNVVDANGCSLSRQIVMASPPSDLDIDVTTLTSTCATGGTAVVEAISAVGSGNYEFGIVEFNTAPYTLTYLPPDTPGGSIRTFTNLTPGVVYTFVVHDITTDCYFVKSADTPIAPASPMTSTVTPNNVQCVGEDNGSVTFTIDSFDATTTSVEYQIFTAFTNVAVGGSTTIPVTFGTPETVTTPSPGTLAPGQYYVRFIENGTGAFNGCQSASAIFEIRESAIDLSITANVTKTENCNELGTVSAIARDGTAPYRYQITTSATPPLATDPSWASANVFNVAANTYFVHVIDAYGCIKTSTAQVVTRDTDPTLTPVAQQCYTGSPLSITLVEGTGLAITPLTYSINGGTSYQTGDTFAINAPGTYDLRIRDGNGCETAVQSYVVAPQVLLMADLTQDLTCNVSASVTLTASGGTGAYATYEVSFNSGAYVGIGGTPYTTTVAGTYQFRVTDSQGCPAESNIVTVTPLTTPTLTEEHFDVTCNGGNDGSIVVTADNGLVPYEYSINNGGAFQSSNTFNGLTAAGSPYLVVVRDDKGCVSAATSVTITEPDALDGTALLTQGLTCGTNNATQAATITANGIDGTAPYRYSFNGGGFTTTNTFTVTTAGTVTVVIRDANDCEFTATPVNVPALSPPSDLDFAAPAITCTATTTTVTATVTGGVGPTFTYSIVSPSGSVTSNTTGIFPGLAPDTYLFRVSDANMCIYEESYTVASVTNISVSGLLVSDVNCNGGTDGAVTFTVGNFSGTYSYRINGGVPITGQSAATIPLTALAAGSYVIEITDEVTNCPATASITVAEPSAVALIELLPSVNANCNFGAQVTVEASGGTPGYTYAFVQDGVAPVPGDYTTSASRVLDPAVSTDWDVYALDSRGCISNVVDVTVATDPLPTLNTVAPQCYVGSPLSITLVEGTGSAIMPLTYSINGGTSYQTGDTFTINAPGAYDLRIRDGNGCETAVQSYVVESQILLSAALTKDLDCTVSPDAVITLTAVGGVAPYTYEVSTNGGSTYTVITGSPYTAATAGTYQFRVTDSQGVTACTDESDEVNVTTPTTPTFTAIPDGRVTCNGDTDGTIVVPTPTGGVGPYEYSINGGSTYQPSNVFENLAPATYNVVVRDSKECVSLVDQVDITEPDALDGTALLTQGLTCGTNNATQAATITANGIDGTAPYRYSFNGGGFTTTNTFTVTTAGTVTVVIRDANDCEFTATPVNVPALSPPSDLDFAAPAITCTATTTTVTATVTGGVGPTFTYSIVSPSGSVTSNTTGIFPGLAPDTYLFRVSDANMCIYEESYTVASVTNISVSGLLVSDVNCNGGTDGAVTFTVGNFSGTYSYRINGGVPITGQSAATIPLTALAAGSYVIEITDEVTNCPATASITVAEPSAVALIELLPSVNANCNFGAQVTVEASGGTPGYTYAFVQDGVAPVPGDYTTSASRVLDPAVSTDWDVYALDSRGCISNVVDVTVATDPLPTLNTVAPQCYVGSPLSITLVEGTGSAIMPLTYSISGGATYQTGDTFTINAPGAYDLRIRDGNGCETAVQSYVVESQILLSAALTKDLDCTVSPDAVITLTAVGGVAPYTYEVSTNGGSTYTVITGSPYTAATAGTYQFRVTDSQGVTACTDESDEVNVTTPTTPTFTAIPDGRVTCNGDTDGTIVVPTPTGGVGPYEYSINGGSTYQPSNVFENLAPATYNVVVRDSKACVSLADQVDITEPPVLVASGSATDFVCAADNSVNTATITVNEVGGTAPYTYSIDGTNYGMANTFDVIDTGSVQNITVYVRDFNGCIDTEIVTINPLPALISATGVIAAPIDCNGTGSVEINVVGGSGNFTYQMLPDGTAQASNTFSITAPGDYFFQVNDLDTGCYIQTAPFNVPPFDTIEAEATPTMAVTCFGDTNGAFEINITGYSGAYTYEVFNGATSVMGPVAANTSTNPLTVSGLSGGSYTVEIVETDSPFCSTTSNVFTIDSPSEALTLDARETANVTCDNDAGVITATAQGGWGDYEYELTGAASVAYSPNGTFTGLSAGVYTVNVRDAMGCIVPSNITLMAPTAITADIAAMPPLLACFGDSNASITVSNVMGGQGSNYTYILNTVSPIATSSGPQSTPVFNNLGVGTYNVTVMDGYNCSFTTVDVIINQPIEIEVSLAQTTTQTCEVDPVLTLMASGGTGSYEYSNIPNFTVGTGTPFAGTVTIPVGRPTGTADSYAYYVRDANGCIANISNGITVEPFIPTTIGLVADASDLEVNCAGDNNGAIVVMAENGIGNYMYELLDASTTPATPITQNTTGEFRNLTTGIYEIRVVDGDCNNSITQEITGPTDPLFVEPINPEPICFGELGSVEIMASGGTPPYQYAIASPTNPFFNRTFEQFFDNPLIEFLPAGFEYLVLVTDSKGCTLDPIAFTLSELPEIRFTEVDLIEETCRGDMDGFLSIEVSGGRLPYHVTVDGVTIQGGPTQTIFEFSNLGGGNKNISIIGNDGLGCPGGNSDYAFPTSPDIRATVALEEVCRDNVPGYDVTVNVEDDPSVDLDDLSYTLVTADASDDSVIAESPVQLGNVFTYVPASPSGTYYYINVTHTNTCVSPTDNFVIDDVQPLEVVLRNVNQTLNTIEAIATNGFGNYTYTFRLNGQELYSGSENELVIFESGIYEVIVSDGVSCEARAEMFFEFVDVCISNYFTPNGDGTLDGWGPGCTANYPNLTVDIFDRYGRKVATLAVNDKWDGTYNGKELPTGDYWYVVKLNDENYQGDGEFVGHFTLYR